MPKEETYIIDGRRSSIYFFSVIFFVLFLIPIILLTPELVIWNHIEYLNIILLLPVVIVKVGFPKTKLGKWLATSVVLYRFK